MSKYLKLGFKTDNGKILSLSISNANGSVSVDTIKAAMDTIIDSDVLKSVDGDLVSRESAELVETNVGEITI